MRVTREEMRAVLTALLDSLKEFPDGGSETPFEQSLGLPGKRFMTVFFIEADRKIFDREESNN